MHLTPQAYVFLGLTAIVAGLVAVVVFAMLRFSLAARETRRQIRTGSSAENTVFSAALQEAVTRLKAQAFGDIDMAGLHRLIPYWPCGGDTYLEM